MKLISKKLLSTFLCALAISTISHADSGSVVWSKTSAHDNSSQNDVRINANKAINDFLTSSSNKLEVECQVVSVNISLSSEIYYSSDEQCAYINKCPSYNVYAYDASVTCEKRNYTDSALMSLAKFCIESPNEKCFDPEIMKSISKIKPTKYKR